MSGLDSFSRVYEQAADPSSRWQNKVSNFDGE